VNEVNVPANVSHKLVLITISRNSKHRFTKKNGRRLEVVEVYRS